ncbi:chorismate mutase [Streptococcus ovis]|uniref:chorismate mutase n=1 Tax=Streptococcus ovis TaxID=82806 RepID=UPI000361556D|nr:chorismate mutase [Streptococcus ovis]
MKLDLTQIRQNIDAIDKELVALLEQRMSLVHQVAAYKKETGQPVLDSGREKAVLEQVATLVENKNYTDSICATFRDIMAHSRAYQSQTLGQTDD